MTAEVETEVQNSQRIFGQNHTLWCFIITAYVESKELHNHEIGLEGIRKIRKSLEHSLIINSKRYTNDSKVTLVSQLITSQPLSSLQSDRMVLNMLIDIIYTNYEVFDALIHELQLQAFAPLLVNYIPYNSFGKILVGIDQTISRMLSNPKEFQSLVSEVLNLRADRVELSFPDHAAKERFASLIHTLESFPNVMAKDIQTNEILERALDTIFLYRRLYDNTYRPRVDALFNLPQIAIQGLEVFMHASKHPLFFSHAQVELQALRNIFYHKKELKSVEAILSSIGQTPEQARHFEKTIRNLVDKSIFVLDINTSRQLCTYSPELSYILCSAGNIADLYISIAYWNLEEKKEIEHIIGDLTTQLTEVIKNLEIQDRRTRLEQMQSAVTHIQTLLYPERTEKEKELYITDGDFILAFRTFFPSSRTLLEIYSQIMRLSYDDIVKKVIPSVLKMLGEREDIVTKELTQHHVTKMLKDTDILTHTP